MKNIKASADFIGYKVVARDGYEESIGTIVDFVPGDFLVRCHNVVRFFDSGLVTRDETVFSYSSEDSDYELLFH